MSERTFKKVSEILSQGIVPPRPESYSESALFHAWKAAAGDAIARHTVITRIKGSAIEVEVDSPIWAHRVIHEQESILAKLRELEYPHLFTLSLRLSVPRPAAKQPPQPPPKSHAKRISPEVSELFKQLAKQGEHVELKEIYSKLAQLKPKNYGSQRTLRGFFLSQNSIRVTD